jgi:hypothetical protein
MLVLLSRPLGPLRRVILAVASALFEASPGTCSLVIYIKNRVVENGPLKGQRHRADPACRVPIDDG